MLATAAFDAFDARRSQTLSWTEAEMTINALGVDVTRQELLRHLESYADAANKTVSRKAFVTIATRLAPTPFSPDDQFCGFSLLDRAQSARVSPAMLTSATAAPEFLRRDKVCVNRAARRWSSYPDKGLSLQEYRALVTATLSDKGA